jgi:hypothetical protein
MAMVLRSMAIVEDWVRCAAALVEGDGRRGDQGDDGADDGRTGATQVGGQRDVASALCTVCQRDTGVDRWAWRRIRIAW